MSQSWNKKETSAIDVPDYTTAHCSTDGANVGALIYIKQNITYKTRNDLKIYENKELKLIFVEIINKSSCVNVWSPMILLT